MATTLLYTFRTFRAIAELQTLCEDTFIFSSLKKDLAYFEDLIQHKKPQFILGIASTPGVSRIEPIAINKFNKGTITKNGPETVNLYLPPHYLQRFVVATQPTHSFCNWTMYKTKLFLSTSAVRAQLSFIHLNIGDMGVLASLFKEASITMQKL